MLKKPHNQIKTGNVSKIKYFIPNNYENKNDLPVYEQSRLNQIKRSINNKYKASYSNSKQSSKRPSAQKIQIHGESLNSQINFNEDVSFEIVGIRDTNETNKISREKNTPYPLNQTNNYVINNLHQKRKQSGMNLTFRNQQQKILNSQSSTFDKINKIKEFQKFTSNFPKPEEQEEFESFLQNLPNDQNYQNTITMFTIMYFYQQRANKK